MALLTVQEVFERVDDQRRDGGDTPVDVNKKLRALNGLLKMLLARANWKFAIRTKSIDYLRGYVDYHLENVLGITDFRAIKDLRPLNYTQPFDNKEEDDFNLDVSRGDSRPMVTVEFREGLPVLRINYSGGQKPQDTLHAATAYDDNGTWAADATTDALNVRTDDVEFKEGSASIAFDIDVSQSANNKATIAVPAITTALDLTDYNDVGRIRAWVYIPSGLLAYLSSLELRWGSDASNYWSDTVTVPADNGSFKAGWNQVEFLWDGATENGTPVVTAVDYLLFTVNYTASAVDAVGVRINDIKITYPEQFEFRYFGNFLVKTTAGVYLLDATSSSDYLLVPHEHRETLVEGVLWQVMDQAGSANSEDSERHRMLFNYGPDYDPAKPIRARIGGLAAMVKEYGVSINVTRHKFKLKMIRET